MTKIKTLVAIMLTAHITCLSAKDSQEERIQNLERKVQIMASIMDNLGRDSTRIDDEQRLQGTRLSRLEDRIPRITTNDEKIYNRFIKGKLIYKPNKDNDIGRVEIPFSTLSEPLNGVFDLSDKSKFGDLDEYLSISTGYHMQQNTKEKKVKIYIVPRFVVFDDSENTSHLVRVKNNWHKNDIGIFSKWGDWTDSSCYDFSHYDFAQLASRNLYQLDCDSGIWGMYGVLSRIDSLIKNGRFFYGRESGSEWRDYAKKITFKFPESLT